MSLSEIAIMDSFRVVRPFLKDIVEKSDEAMIEEVTRALSDLKVHYPDEIDDFLSSSESELLRKRQVQVKASGAQSVEMLSRQMAASTGNLAKYLVSDPNTRKEFADAWVCAAACRSFNRKSERKLLLWVKNPKVRNPRLASV